jgi:hypothetical protein
MACSLSVRLKCSATPWVCGSALRPKLGAMPQNLAWLRKSSAVYHYGGFDALRRKPRLGAMVRKEIAAHLLAYNLVRTVMAQAACLAHLLPRQLSFKATLQVLNAFEENLRFCPHARLTTRHAIVVRRHDKLTP